mgnify:CR=1 FL=1
MAGTEQDTGGGGGGMDWLGLAGSLIAPGIGGLIGNLGQSLLQTGGAAGQSAASAADALAKNAPWRTKQNMFNAAGQSGPQVEQGFKTALDSLQNSAGAINAASDANQAADTLASSVGTNTNIARTQQNNATRAMRNELSGALRGAGANPAAMVAGFGKLGEASSQGSLALLGQAGQQAQAAAAQGGAMRLQAQNTLDQNLANRNQIYVDPYKAQVNNTGAEAGVAAQAAGDTQVYSPFQGVASILGKAGSGLLENVFSNQTGDGQKQTTVNAPGGTIAQGTTPITGFNIDWSKFNPNV